MGYGMGGGMGGGRGGGMPHPPPPPEPPEPKRARVESLSQGSRLIKVRTNFSTISIGPSLRISQYELKFDPEVLKPEKRRELLEREFPMTELLRASGERTGASGYVYDGRLIVLVANGTFELNEAAQAAGWSDVHGNGATLSATIGEGGRQPLTITLTRSGGPDHFLRFDE